MYFWLLLLYNGRQVTGKSNTFNNSLQNQVTHLMNQQIIIVDGLDRCGKDTLVDLLKQQKPETPVFKDTGPNPVDRDQLEYYANLLESIPSNIIFNRSFLGEFVYGQIYRNKSYSDDDYINIESKLDDKKVSLIILTDSNLDSRLTREDGNSIPGNPEQLADEYSKFRQYFELSKIKNKQFVDWNYQPFNQATLDEIIKKAIDN